MLAHIQGLITRRSLVRILPSVLKGRDRLRSRLLLLEPWCAMMKTFTVDNQWTDHEVAPALVTGQKGPSARYYQGNSVFRKSAGKQLEVSFKEGQG